MNKSGFRKLAALFSASVTLCVSTVIPINVSAESAEYENLIYREIDENSDGISDFIEITGCDIEAVQIEIPEKIKKIPVESIGDYAFCNCTALKEIYIPSSVNNIGRLCFAGSAVSEINVSEQNKSFSSNDGVLFNKDKSQLLIYPQNKSGDYAIPAGVEIIGKEAFYKSIVTSVEFSESVNIVSESAFSKCENLTEIYLPENVSQVKEAAFSFCSNLKKITFENAACNICASNYTINNGCTDSEFIFSGTVYGYENSSAQLYAEECGYNFQKTDIVEILLGDANLDKKVNVRDCAFISLMLAQGKADQLPEEADYNCDSKKNVRDAAAIANSLS